MDIFAPFKWIKESRLVTGPTWAISTLWNSRPVRWMSTGYNTYCCYHLFGSAIPNLLVLNTYRHGTSIKNYISINFTGLDPSRGGDPKSGGEATLFSLEGEHSPYADRDGGYVYLAGDTHHPLPSHVRPLERYEIWIKKKYGVHNAYRFGANFALAKRGINHNLGAGALAFLPFLLTPTIKVHFAQEEANEHPNGIEDDSTMGYDAVRTKHHLGWNHIGISGALWQGLKHPNLPKRAIRDPRRFCTGLIQGTLAVCATAKLFGKSIQLPAPELLHRLWEYRLFRWPIEYAIRFSAW
ncbi:MAG: hypothetical protein AB7F31_01965 [Parachlamydiales bacterium]